MTLLLAGGRTRSLLDSQPWIPNASLGAGRESRAIHDRLLAMRTLLSEEVSSLAAIKETRPHGKDFAGRLASKSAAFKMMTSRIAMYLDPSWRSTLFATLDRMLDADCWDDEAALPSEQSFSTFLRMIIYLHPTKRPGLGLSPSGHFLAAWRRETDRIVIECLAQDEVRWVLARTVDGQRESGAGKVLLHRVPDVIAGYEPEAMFHGGEKVLA